MSLSFHKPNRAKKAKDSKKTAVKAFLAFFFIKKKLTLTDHLKMLTCGLVRSKLHNLLLPKTGAV
jgi:hypothetical protein